MTVRVLGKHFSYKEFSGNAGEVATLITPAQNVNGILLYDVRTWAQNAITVGITPPANRFSTENPLIYVGTEVFQPFLIPAGLGVFIQLSQSYNIPVRMRWDYLNADGTVA